jgi:hypothetical protein
MTTKFLRKIILEELRKVLKEETLTGQDKSWNIGPNDKSWNITGKDKTWNITGKDKSYPVDTRGDDLGPCVNPGDPGCRDSSVPSVKKTGNPKVLQYQKAFNKVASKLGLKKLKEDGIAGKDTVAIHHLTVGGDAKNLLKNIDSHISFLQDLNVNPSKLAALKNYIFKDPGEVETAGENIFDLDTAVSKPELEESLLRKQLARMLKNL